MLLIHCQNLPDLLMEGLGVMTGDVCRYLGWGAIT